MNDHLSLSRIRQFLNWIEKKSFFCEKKNEFSFIQLFLRRSNNQQNDTQPNDVQQNDSIMMFSNNKQNDSIITINNNKQNDTQNNDNQENDTKMTISNNQKNDS